MLAPTHRVHIGSDLAGKRAEVSRIPHEMGDPSTPQLVLGREACGGWTRAAGQKCNTNFDCQAATSAAQAFATDATMAADRRIVAPAAA
jgi:hypothetical protein